MLLKKTRRILEQMHRDRRGMVPAKDDDAEESDKAVSEAAADESEAAEEAAEDIKRSAEDAEEKIDEGLSEGAAPSPKPSPAPAEPTKAPDTNVNVKVEMPKEKGSSERKSSGDVGFANKIMGGGGAGAGGADVQPLPWFSIFVTLIAVVIAAFLIKTTQGGFYPALPALIPLGILVAAFFSLYFLKPIYPRIALILFIVLLCVAVYGLATVTTPRLVAAWGAGEVAQSAEEAAVSTQESAKSIVDRAIESYERQVAIATGQHIQGEVDQTVKEEVGVEILPPYLPNPERINEQELGSLEINARIKGFDPKTPLKVLVFCHMQSRWEAANILQASSGSKGPNMNPGTKQDLRPEFFEDYTFNREVTCKPKPAQCGPYVVTVSAHAENLRTDAQMQNYIISKEYLDQRLRNYAEEQGKELRSESDVNSAINALYGKELGKYLSISDKGAIKVVMVTQPVPLIGVDQDTDLTLRAGVENMKDGWIMNITSVEITIPDYFRTVDGFCDNWEIKDGDKLVLKESYLKTTNFREVPKSQQKIFPSCHLVPKQDTLLNQPTEVTFLALVEYNYVVQQEYNIEVRNATGGLCKEVKTTTTTTPSSVTEPSTTALKGISRTDFPEVRDFVRSVEACRDKFEGDVCGLREYCLGLGEVLACVPECTYYADTSQQQLNPQYGCFQPSECGSTTASTFSCKSSFLAGPSSTCCISEDVTTAPSITVNDVEDAREAIRAVDACAKLTEGERCGSSERCMRSEDLLYCVPDCDYYASVGEEGLTTEYYCLSPENCREGTARAFNCVSSYFSETSGRSCCIPVIE